MVGGEDGRTEQGRHRKEEREECGKCQGSKWEGTAAGPARPHLARRYAKEEGRHREGKGGCEGRDEWNSGEFSGLLSVKGLGDGCSRPDRQRLETSLKDAARRGAAASSRSGLRTEQEGVKWRPGSKQVIQPILHSLEKQVLAQTGRSTHWSQDIKHKTAARPRDAAILALIKY